MITDPREECEHLDEDLEVNADRTLVICHRCGGRWPQVRTSPGLDAMLFDTRPAPPA